MGISSGTTTRWLFVHCVQIELKFRNVGFWGEGKTEVPGEKTSRSKDENQQQTQRTYDTWTGNRTWPTLVEGECSNHCAIPAPRAYTVRERDKLHQFNL